MNEPSAIEASTEPEVAAPPAESWVSKWSRRALSFSALTMLFAAFVLSFPLTLPLSLLVDLVRRTRWSLTRFLFVVFIYLGCEVLGLALGFLIWVPGVLGGANARFLDRNYRLQRWWVRSIFEGSRWAFGARLEVEGLQHVSSGPVLLLVRHASLVDTLLPTRFVSTLSGLRLRFVLKEELLWDPCLDLVGHRLPNAFVRRGGDTRSDVAAVERLAAELGPMDGVLLFPEGTRFSPQRRDRALARIESRGDHHELARATALQNLLPLRLGGLLALLESAPHVDVAFCAHHGLGGVRTFGDLMNGKLVERTISVGFWRCAASSIPEPRAAKIEWLYDQWTEVDRFVGAREEEQHATLERK